MNSPFEPPTGDPVWPATPATGDGGHARRRRTRRNTALGVSAGVLGGGAVGLLMMMPSFSSAASTETPDSTVAAVDESSTDTGTETDSTAPAETPAEAPDATARLREALQPLVDDGTITAEQADAVVAQLAEEFPGRGGWGHGGPGRGGHPGFDGEVLAGLLGIDVETLRSELADGSTIAEIAANHGVDVQTVIDALVAEATTHLDQMVTDGRLTQEEADSKLTDLTERITDRVNNGGGFERGGGRGPRGGEEQVPAPAESADDTSATADAGS